MKIKDLFVKPIDRPIDGVIKADDQRHIDVELEEFVITREIGRGLDDFIERYLNEKNSNGVWISGFFGSGKSHLLKILSLILDESPTPSGKRPADILLPHIEDEILKDNLLKATRIPSKSLLFNIDQKADHIGGDSGSPILEVFMKVFNELRGYDSKQGYVAKFEFDLDRSGKLEAFKETYLRINERPWEKDRDAIGTVRRKAFGAAFAAHMGVPEEESYKVLNQIREDYKLSIESFAEQVKEYIDSRGPDFRLNFFVDEAGQFIGNNSKLMLNLQTVAETLGTKCNGRAWVFVTSQADIKSILGDLEGSAGVDFSKIQGRFKSRLNLTSTDVKEVIQRRLLAKVEEEPAVLTSIYDKEKENLETLFRFSDDSVQYKGWRGSDEFCALYPFHPYQFDLFQRAIEQLSKHEAFTGRHTAVGERSMLEVFQRVAMSLKDEKAGSLAVFDRMFDGISGTIRGDLQTSILQAGKQLDHPLAIRILKALFLLKWFREFKATIRNIAILLIDRGDIDIAAHEKGVKEALGILTAQSYLQLNGDVYEFLTDTEKDIEKEIKSTEIDESQVTKLLTAVIFDDVVKSPKIRFEGNGQDYPFAHKIDDHLVSKDAELVLNVITPEHPNHGDERTLAAQGTGKAELTLILPQDYRLMEEARLYLKTEKYIQQSMGANLDPSRKVILDERRKQNGARRSLLQQHCGDLFVKAPIYLNGSKLEGITTADPKTRFHKAAQELITFSFPSLRMLKGTYDEAMLRNTLLDQDDLLTSGGHPISEAEQEILTYVLRNQNLGERSTVEEMVRYFGRRPYGWHSYAVITLISRLFRMGKMELRAPDSLDSKAALELLQNSREHGNVRVRLQEQFDPAKTNALKKFYQQFFDRANEGTDAQSAARSTVEAMQSELDSLSSYLQRIDRYPFLESIRRTEETLRKVAAKDFTYLINQLKEFDEVLLEAKENFLDPIKTFMNGPQRTAYDEVMTFLSEQQANFGELPEEEILPIRALATASNPFRGRAVPDAKEAMKRVAGLIETKLQAERDSALIVLIEHEEKLKATPEFSKLLKEDADRALAKSSEARTSISTEKFITGIRDRINRYRTTDYPAQLSLIAELAKPRAAEGGKEASAPAAVYVSLSVLTSQVKCSLPFIGSQADLDHWVEAVKAAATKELEKGKSAVPTEDIPAVTQLFTPHWIVRYLVENSLGRLWMLNHPKSKLREQMPYYIEGEAETDFLKIGKPEEIKLVDPAAGSGHMLTYAYDLLVKIYEEEGYPTSEIPEKILTHNLYGLEICPRAAQLAQFALVCKAREITRTAFRSPIQPQVICLQDISFEENELKEYIGTLKLGDLFSQPVLKLMHQFEQATNFGSLIQPCIDEKAISELRTAIEGKDLGGQLFLRETHRKVLRVLEQAEALTQRYHVVVANPPYMGLRQMNAQLVTFAEAAYPAAKYDLYSMFIARCAALLKDDAVGGMITMQGWMFLNSFDAFRKEFLNSLQILTLAHLGARAFDSIAGEVVQCAAFCFSRGATDSNRYGAYFRLTDEMSGEEKRQAFIEKKANGDAGAFRRCSRDFTHIPGSPVAYWLSPGMIQPFKDKPSLGQLVDARQGLATSDNGRFLRSWWEVESVRICRAATSRDSAKKSNKKWFPINKGGPFRKWYGNHDNVINWGNDGEEVIAYAAKLYGSATRTIKSISEYFKPSVSWSDITTNINAFRYYPGGFIFDATGHSSFPNEKCSTEQLLAFCNCKYAQAVIGALNPTMHFHVGYFKILPAALLEQNVVESFVQEMISIARADWDNFETSWDFRDQPLLRPGLKGATLEASWRNWEAQSTSAIRRMQDLETENNRLFIAAYGLDGELQAGVPEEQITLARAEARRDMAAFLSYAVGCMMGRYSLDKPGLILADAGDTVENYIKKVDKPLDQISFPPDEDAIIPVLEGEWFSDEIVARTRKFLRVTFGESTLNENLRFIEESLGKSLEKYFLTDFYKDHLQTYKKRPIYWLFQSPKKGFSALVYMHRYSKDTCNTLLNSYLREYIKKIDGKISHLEHVSATADSSREKTSANKELEKLRKVLKECQDWERETLLPLAHAWRYNKR